MIDWKIATLISSKLIASNIKSLIFKLDRPILFKAGQHLNIKLTSEDGYTAERDYSLMNAPEDNQIAELGVELLNEGEVSPYLHQLKEGDQIEIRGPIGGYFVWDINIPGPLVLIGGGSGMVPLLSMLRHHINNLEKDKNRNILFLISAKSKDRILNIEELKTLSTKDPQTKIVQTLTKEIPANWTGYTRRIDKPMLQELLKDIKDKVPTFYICGPTLFVETVATLLVELGYNFHSIKTERFGG